MVSLSLSSGLPNSRVSNFTVTVVRLPGFTVWVSLVAVTPCAGVHSRLTLSGERPLLTISKRAVTTVPASTVPSRTTFSAGNCATGARRNSSSLRREKSSSTCAITSTRAMPATLVSLGCSGSLSSTTSSLLKPHCGARLVS